MTKTITYLYENNTLFRTDELLDVWVLFENKLEGDLPRQQDKGKFHEMLVTDILNREKMPVAGAQLQKQYTQHLGGQSSDLYQHHRRRAEVAAAAIRDHLSNLGQSVSNVTWVGKGSGEARRDPADIVVRSNTGEEHRFSLKATDKPGEKFSIKTLSKQPVMERPIARARQQYTDFPEREKDIRAQLLKSSADALINHYRNLQRNDKPRLIDHLLNTIHGNAAPHLVVHTKGTGPNYQTSIQDTTEAYRNMLSSGKFRIVRSGNNTIVFQGKGIGFAHRVKRASGKDPFAVTINVEPRKT